VGYTLIVSSGWSVEFGKGVEVMGDDGASVAVGSGDRLEHEATNKAMNKAKYFRLFIV
jgi:hypothetical protein